MSVKHRTSPAENQNSNGEENIEEVPEYQEEEKQEKKYERKLLFEYPALPKAEMSVYWSVMACVFIYAWYCIWDASAKYEWSYGWGRGRVEILPFFGRRIKDISNYEWDKWRPLAFKLAPAMLLHNVLFTCDRFFGQKYKIVWEVLTMSYSIGACCVIFDVTSVLVSLAHGFVIFGITRFFRNKYAVWLSTLPVLWMTLHNPFLLPITDPFYPLILHAYKLLCYISYNLDYIDKRTRKEDEGFLRGFFRMIYYSFYMPYLVSLIVLYHNFERQLEERRSKIRDWKEIICFGLRIAFWFFLCDFILYFFYFEAILYDNVTLYQLTQDRLNAVGYAIGQFFHLKYVVIFGVPSFFARIDNMQPVDGPICISRVTLYSKIWRQFDRGLYAFFKEYIFMPIIRPTFSIWRKIFGVLISYTFVLIWHGTHHNNFVWIILNVTGLFMESGAKAIYSIPAVSDFRQKYLSDRNFRRVLAWLQIVPFAFALYSNFYFLAGSDAGWVFVDRIFWGETYTLQWPFFLLISLGYCYSHVCMEVDRLQAAGKKQALKQD